MHRKQLALNEIRLGRLAQPDGDIGLAHRQIKLLVGGKERDVDLGIEVGELAQPRSEPMHTKADCGLHLQLAMRLLATVGELGARRLQLHEHFMRGAVKQFALFGEDQAARMAME